MKKFAILFVLLFLIFCYGCEKKSEISTEQNTIPEWQWAVKAGGGGSDKGNDIVIDNWGNIYITGCFSSTGTATFGTHSLIGSGNSNIFVAKMDANGNWEWAKKAGGSVSSEGIKIATCETGEICITGYFYGTITFDSFSLTSSGYTDIFVAKIDASGNWLWATKGGGNNSDSVSGIVTDELGNIYITGSYKGTAAFGTHSLTDGGGFTAKMDANGNWLWATKGGGSGGLTLNELGGIYVTGTFSGVENFGSHSITSNGFENVFIAKIDTNGNWLWAIFADGIQSWSRGISTDETGNIFVIGAFAGDVTFGFNTLTDRGLFVAKIDKSGNWLWATQVDGRGEDGSGFILTAYSITIDREGNNYITGNFQETATFGSHSIISSGYNDTFVAKINSNGSWQWAIQAESSIWYDDLGITNTGLGIAIDGSGSVCITGYCTGELTFGSHSINGVENSGSKGREIFVAKLK